MNHLLRELAPISADAWAQIDDEAKTRLTTYLAGRRLVDFSDPEGWDYSAHNLGRTTEVASPGAGVQARLRQVAPLLELRVPFILLRDEIANASRGNNAIDLGPLEDATKAIALAENTAIFHGYAAGGITGITEAASHDPVAIPAEWDEFPRAVAVGVERLLLAGIRGPYGLALGDDAWVGVVEATERGSTLIGHLGSIVDGGPIVWAPGVRGAIVVSQRGGDFTIDAGQDLSIGYSHHDADTVTLYLEESFTFRVEEPDAAVTLHRP